MFVSSFQRLISPHAGKLTGSVGFSRPPGPYRKRRFNQWRRGKAGADQCLLGCAEGEARPRYINWTN